MDRAEKRKRLRHQSVTGNVSAPGSKCLHFAGKKKILDLNLKNKVAVEKIRKFLGVWWKKKYYLKK